MRRKNQRGLTLVELVVAFSIMLILTTMAVPLARSRVRIEREKELRWAEREIRAAIDKYKDYADAVLENAGLPCRRADQPRSARVRDERQLVCVGIEGNRAAVDGAQAGPDV